MGDLAEDTAVVQVDTEHFRAEVSADWEIWGPMGGYIASIALRAVGATSPFRPASFFCQYLGVAAFDTVDVAVTELRSARTAAAHRAEITQNGKRIMEATVWSVGDVEGLEHDVAAPPPVTGAGRAQVGTGAPRRGERRHRPTAVPVLEQPREQAARLPPRLATARAAAPVMAGMEPVRPDRDL